MGAWGEGAFCSDLFGVKISPLSCQSVYSVPVLAFIYFIFFKEIISALKPGKKRDAGCVGGGGGGRVRVSSSLGDEL